MVLLLGIMLVTGVAYSQHPISNALYRLMDDGDFDLAERSIETYSIKELAELPDSVLFDYYYLKAVIRGNEGNERSKRKYLLEAKNLCEKSQGIHSPVYLEICWAIGKSFEEEGDTLAAYEIYQAALIQSIGLYSLTDEDVKWQYEEINDKVIEWYKDKALRKAMINSRETLLPRAVSRDAVQNDMEFYFQYYQDEQAKALISKADKLNESAEWEEAAKIYLDVASTTKNNPIAKATLQELAAMNYINVEDFQLAEDLLLNNLQLLETHKKSKVYRKTLSQLSNLYSAIHNYDKAKNYASAAKFWYEEVLDFSRGYILCLHRCATLERGNNNYFLALLLEDVALQELHKNKVFGIISGNAISREQFLANLLSSAAMHYNQVGFRDDAYEYIETAIEIAESNNLDASSYYNNLADICIAARDYDKAALAGERAYDLSNSGNSKVQIGTTLCLSQFLARQPISTDAVTESSKYLNTLISQTFSFTSTEERKNFWSYFEYHFPLLNFLAYQSGNNDLYGQIYDNILVAKGLLLRTANSLRDQILNTGSNGDIAKYEHLLQLRKLLPSLNQDEATAVMSEIEKIDKELTVKFNSYADFTNSSGITWRNVQEHLNADEIAIEFYNIPEVSWHDDGKDLDGEYRYCAVTLRKGYDKPHIIPLITDERLNSVAQEDYYETDSIYNLIWKPLAEELHDIENIYFSADRELHKIGIEYAPLSDGSNIADKYRLYRLSSTRVLAENKTTSKKESAVLYGGLRYDLNRDDLIAESRTGDYHPIGASRAFTAENSRYGVKFLPGTLKEVTEISQSFHATPRVITDISGTEESFKSLAGSAIDIIHLATHGFFWTSEDAEKRNYVTFLNQGNNTFGEDKALMRSGLFFSGANIGLKGETLPDDVEDGVLTALELSNMNLGNVDMVVMSACESGLGETSGEGVFGLQRGFKLAGANTLLMSLWKVDDTATQKLMTEFYKHYLSGKTKQESLHLAQESLRNSSDYSDPQYWAAFILLDGLN